MQYYYEMLSFTVLQPNTGITGWLAELNSNLALVTILCQLPHCSHGNTMQVNINIQEALQQYGHSRNLCEANHNNGA